MLSNDAFAQAKKSRLKEHMRAFIDKHIIAVDDVIPSILFLNS